ncbi:MAG: hypothetical protein QME49_07015 [bacterium]|nr:hypothetical protein [bacterium]
MRLNKSLSIGAAIQNLGSKIRFVNEGDRLPLTFKLEGAYKTGSRLLITIDANKPVDNNFKLNVGAEYLVANMFAVRGGCSSDKEQGSNFTVGAGFCLRDCHIDYALVPYGDLGKTHQISFSLR